MGMRYGTSHFISIRAAGEYYAATEGGINAGIEAARRKIEAGEIHIGKPATKPGEKVYMDQAGRYFVESTPERVQKFSMIHPRCGTAFLLWVLVLGLFVFAFVGTPSWYWLILSRILLLPVIAGLAYELIRYAGKHQGNRVLMALLAPGLWLQRLTTREPTDDQVEVSIQALRSVLDREAAETPEQRRLESRVEVMA